jgi:DNA-binding NtrC family response regulator
MDSSSPPRLIIVDDDPDVRDSIGQALSAEGYEIEPAASGLEALEMMRNAAYDVMLLDLRMPGLHGLDVVLQAQDIQPKMAIIIMTAHASVESAVAGIRTDQVVDYLTKPVSLGELLRAMDKALQMNADRR